MKRLVIHIGIEKTGTTSLQHYLYLNESLLAEQGIGLLHCVGEPNNRQLARYADPTEIQPPQHWRGRMPEGQNWRQVLRQELHAEVKALPAHIHTVVVSSEHLHSRLRKLEEVRQVAELFEGLFDSTDIVVYLRRQDRLAVSLFSTALRGGWTQSSPLPPSSAGRLQFYGFDELLDRWAQVFGEQHIRARIFERSRFINGDLYDDFLSACGWPQLCGKLEIPPVQNEALSAVAATALLHLNRAVAALVGEHEQRPGKKLRKAMADALTARYPGPGLLPSREQAMAFQQDFQASNQELARRWFGGQVAFDAEFSHYPEQASTPDLPPELLPAVLETLVKYVQTLPEHTHRVVAAPGARARKADAAPRKPDDPARAERKAKAQGGGAAEKASVPAQPLAPALAPGAAEHNFILHIGRHKSGTSSLQAFLDLNHESLKAQGYLYPRAGRDKLIAHHPLAAAFAKNPSNGHHRSAPVSMESFSQALAEETKGWQGTIVISSEAFQNVPPQRLAALFPPKRTQVVVYLREQAEYLVSAYQQRVQATHYSGTLLEFMAEFGAADYARFLKRWVEAFGKEQLIVARYDRALLRDSDIVHDFCHRTGVPLLASPAQEDRNPSIGGALLEIKRISNALLQDSVAQNHVYNIYREVALSEKGFRRKSVLPEAMLNELRHSVLESNQDVAANFFNGQTLFKLKPAAHSEAEPVAVSELCQALAGLLAINRQYGSALVEALIKPTEANAVRLETVKNSVLSRLDAGTLPPRLVQALQKLQQPGSQTAWVWNSPITWTA